MAETAWRRCIDSSGVGWRQRLTMPAFNTLDIDDAAPDSVSRARTRLLAAERSSE
jgi:hypothetical protein